VTTEDDFWAILEANPSDHTTRLVLADWLQERGDPRAEGYRALGTLHLAAYFVRTSRFNFDTLYGFSHEGNAALTRRTRDWFRIWFCLLPDPWWKKFRPHNKLHPWDPLHWAYLGSRKEAESTAALCWLELTDQERIEILAKGPFHDQ
jgi:uncharacterized protein (TIGR02996 family)